MALRSEIAGSQIDGARDYQEDAFLITHLTDANGEPVMLQAMWPVIWLFKHLTNQ